MIATLAELIAPLSTEEFRTILRDRTLRHVPGARADGFAALMDWRRLIGLVTDGTYPVTKLRITRGAETLPAMFYSQGDAPRAAAIERIMETNGSLITHGLDAHVPELGALCAAIAGELGEKVLASAIATVGDGGAVKPHYDKSDVLAVQLEGSKKWRFYGDPVPHAVPGMRGASEGSTEPGEIVDIVMEPGDLLVIPSGYSHHCETMGGKSLHMTFFIFPVTAPRILDLLFREMVEDSTAREPIRFAAGDVAAQEQLRERIIRRVREVPFDELLARHFAHDHSPGRNND